MGLLASTDTEKDHYIFQNKGVGRLKVGNSIQMTFSWKNLEISGMVFQG